MKVADVFLDGEEFPIVTIIMNHSFAIDKGDLFCDVEYYQRDKDGNKISNLLIQRVKIKSITKETFGEDILTINLESIK